MANIPFQLRIFAIEVVPFLFPFWGIYDFRICIFVLSVNEVGHWGGHIRIACQDVESARIYLATFPVFRSWYLLHMMPNVPE